MCALGDISWSTHPPSTGFVSLEVVLYTSEDTVHTATDATLSSTTSLAFSKKVQYRMPSPLYQHYRARNLPALAFRNPEAPIFQLRVDFRISTMKLTAAVALLAASASAFAPVQPNGRNVRLITIENWRSVEYAIRQQMKKAARFSPASKSRAFVPQVSL